MSTPRFTHRILIDLLFADNFKDDPDVMKRHKYLTYASSAICSLLDVLSIDYLTDVLIHCASSPEWQTAKGIEVLKNIVDDLSTTMRVQYNEDNARNNAFIYQLKVKLDKIT